MGLTVFAYELHEFCTYALVGLIWVVQLVHYPLMKYVASEKWTEFHQAHTFWITPIAGPLMLGQLISAAGLFAQDPWLAGFSGLHFLFTFGVSVPLHHQLSQEMKNDLIHKLVRTNWLRTVSWTVHAVYLLITKSHQ
ncbi:MAG: hypothetical protein LW875_11800 [Proteobacteria bacterium]|jgi:hypothetical protein|nr:hypothetical protein [Pseudomonadota bacterium]